MNNTYYVYAYLRQDGTPYYIGKGTKYRAWIKGKGEVYPPRDRSKIIIVESGLTEVGSLAIERRLIRWYGRKDIGTGILRNKTDGGDGISGRVMSAKEKASRSGENHPNFGKKRPEISVKQKGELNHFFGKRHSEETLIVQRAKKAGKNNPMFGKKGPLCPNFGKKTTRISCICCKKDLPINVFYQRHNDKCKSSSSDFSQSTIA